MKNAASSNEAVAILMSNVCLAQIEVIKARSRTGVLALGTTAEQYKSIVEMRNNTVKLFESASGEDLGIEFK